MKTGKRWPWSRGAAAGLLTLLSACCSAPAQAQDLAPEIGQMLAFDTPIVVLRDVTLFDGTGTAPKRRWSVVVQDARIAAVGPEKAVTAPSGAKVIDGRGKTLLPGLVGMHQHLFSVAPGSATHAYLGAPQAESAPRLYLAAGVTTARTAGSAFPYADLLVKRAIEAGFQAGPDLDLTGPYLDGTQNGPILNWPLSGPQDARQTIAFWTDRGMTSFKAYDHISREELRVAVAASHARGLKITGHLCTIGFTEAAEMGIDNLEHGLFANAEFVPDRISGVCPERSKQQEWLASADIKGPQIQGLIRTLVDRRVAITSTLAVLEYPGRVPLDRLSEMKQILAPAMWETYLSFRTQWAKAPPEALALYERAFRQEMAFEREFVAQGGLLVAGCDPTGVGNAPAGFGDQRQMELLIEAGFTPAEAVQIYTLNGARYLGRDQVIGTIERGKQADLLLLDGDFESAASAIRRPLLVFKQGRAWDPARLKASVAGWAGIR